MWNPIFTNNSYEGIAISRKLEEIYNSIVSEPNSNFSDGLFGGKSGIANFLFYYSQYSNNSNILEKAFALIQNALFNVNAEKNFSNGLGGIEWQIKHLIDNKFIKVEVGKVSDLNNPSIFDYMKDSIDKGEYDFLHGALGIGLCYLKSESRDYYNYLAYLVNGLEKTIVKFKKGLAWESIIDYDTGQKGVNLSLSHGISSIIVFLSKLFKENILKEKSFYLLEGALDFLFSNTFDINKDGNYFPSWISANGLKENKSRLAWCYGDLGMGISLWITSKNIGSSDLEKKAIQILETTTHRKDLEKEFVIDAGLCHGTTGIAHIYARMYNYTRNESFKNAAMFWYRETLNMAKFDDGLAGYKTWYPEKHGGWQNVLGLLEGISGIGLSLISATSFIDPSWDECLLLS